MLHLAHECRDKRCRCQERQQPGIAAVQERSKPVMVRPRLNGGNVDAKRLIDPAKERVLPLCLCGIDFGNRHREGSDHNTPEYIAEIMPASRQR